MREVTRTMLKNKNMVTATAFIADQTPSPENACWVWFLNQPTPVFRGTEVLARKFNYPVIYFTIKRIKRGKYVCEAKLICAEPKLTKEGEITELHTRMLEADIKREPEIWLWSHKRWKHKPSEEVLQRLKRHNDR
jgi:KDO2-lipid IV(A) lauroyltransferase